MHQAAAKQGTRNLKRTAINEGLGQNRPIGRFDARDYLTAKLKTSGRAVAKRAEPR